MTPSEWVLFTSGKSGAQPCGNRVQPSRLHRCHIRKCPTCAANVEAVADHPYIRDLKADAGVPDRDNPPALGLSKKTQVHSHLEPVAATAVSSNKTRCFSMASGRVPLILAFSSKGRRCRLGGRASKSYRPGRPGSVSLTGSRIWAIWSSVSSFSSRTTSMIVFCSRKARFTTSAALA